jgi:DNA polymerase-1
MALLLLIDGHSQAYRAYFGMKTPLSTRDGELTAAVYGFTRKLLSALKEYNPEYVAVAFDTGDTWRHAEFPAYKATRDAMPDDMRTQMVRIEEMLHAFNIPVVTYPNFEADDILGTLASQAAAQGQDVLIMTGDRDMFQLVTDRVQVLYTSGGPNPVTSVYGTAQVYERYGLTPAQFIDFKALTGDTSDNIPGVPGVGEKTAVKFLQQYGSLDSLYAHIDEISGAKTRQNLIDYAEQVRRNLRLVTISTDFDLVYDAAACRMRSYTRQMRSSPCSTSWNSAACSKSCPPQRMSSRPSAAPWRRQQPDGAVRRTADVHRRSVEIPTAPSNYSCVSTILQLDELLNHLATAAVISFDVETTSADAMQAALVGLGLSWAAGEGAYIPIAHSEGKQLPWATVRARLQPMFADASRPKVAHNAKYDLTVLLRHGLEVAGAIDDTMLMAWLLDPSSRTLGLKALAGQMLAWHMTELSDLIGSGRKQITIDQVAIEQAGAYCGADVDATIQLLAQFAPKLHAADLWPIYTDIERPLLPVLTDMEMAGVLLDTGFPGQDVESN